MKKYLLILPLTLYLSACNNDKKNLFMAIENNDILTIEKIAQKRKNIHSFENKGMNPLTKAAYDGQLNIMKYLHEKIAFPLNKKDANGKTALDYATMAERDDIIEYIEDRQYIFEEMHENISSVEEKVIEELPEKLREELKNSDELPPKGKEFIEKVVKESELISKKIDFKLLKQAFEEGNINLKNKNGEDILFHISAILSLEECLYKLEMYLFDIESEFAFLIQNSADIKSKLYDGGTVLMWALKLGYDEEIIKPLIEKGADVNAKDNNGTTVLMWALKRGYDEEIIKLLIEKGADVNAKDNNGTTVLMWALKRGYDYDYFEEIIKPLIEKGADVNAKDNNGTTVLMWALKLGYGYFEEIFKLLIEKGADVNAKDNNGTTVLMWALEISYNEEIIKLLKENGAKE